MAVIYWRLGDIVRDTEETGPFVVFRQDRVFDTDRQGWELGVRPDMPVAELKWIYPQAAMVAWRPDDYRQAEAGVRRWLKQRAAAYEQEEIRSGWWEWPRLQREEWDRLLAEVTARWARRIEAGIARHPLLARWACEEGARQRLPQWRGEGHHAYIVMPDREEDSWPLLPLHYVPGVAGGTRTSWHKRGWNRVGDVPGLRERIGAYGPQHRSIEIEGIRVQKSFDGGIESGITEGVAVLAGELADRLALRQQGFTRLRLIWEGERGMEIRERQWPVVAGDRRRVTARALSLLSAPPTFPPDRLTLEVELPESVPLDQMGWWPARPSKSKTGFGEIRGVRAGVGRREILLQYWDVWRMRPGMSAR